MDECCISELNCSDLYAEELDKRLQRIIELALLAAKQPVAATIGLNVLTDQIVKIARGEA